MLTMSSPIAVETSGLSKSFGDREVVDQIDLSIPAGSVSGFVGPNAAGKTTTIRMLLGLVRPTAGTGLVLGRSLNHPPSYLDRVGALIESPAFYPQLSARSNLSALARLGQIDRKRIDVVLRRVGLDERADEPFRRFSLGMKQRLGIASALLCDPALLVLDEPTNGLDPAGILEMRALIRSLADDGITVFVSSHLLGEIDQICDHLVMIRAGQLVYQGSMSKLRDSQGIELLAKPEHPDQMSELLFLVRATGRNARPDDDAHGIVVDTDAEWAADLNRLAAGAGITLIRLTERSGSLEEAYFALTGTESGDIDHRTAVGEIR
jgi:ABC-2 type transport system ATP-binding protein